MSSASMIRQIAINDLRQTLRDRWSCLALGLFLVVELMICWNSFQQVTQLNRSQQDQQQAAREDWLSLQNTSAHMATHDGTTVYKILSPISVFDPGLDPVFGMRVRMESHKQHEFVGPLDENRLRLLKFDLTTPALLIQAVFPLLIILLGHAAMKREQIQGTLSLILSMGVGWRTLIFGKLAYLTVLTVLMCLPALAVSGYALVQTTVGPEMALSNAVLRLLTCWGTCLMYLSGWSALVVGLSAYFTSSRLPLIVLFVAWTAATIILPRVAIDMAVSQVPLLPAEEVRDRRLKAIQNLPSQSNELRQRTDEVERRLLEEYGVDRARDLPISIASAKMLETEKYNDELIDQLQNELNDRYARQDQIVQWFESFSPFIAVRSASMTLCGTDRKHHQYFVQSSERYRREFVRIMNTAEMKNEQPQGTEEEMRAFWGRVPPFAYRFPEWSQAMNVAWFPIMINGIWCIGALLLSLCLPKSYQ